MKRTISKCYAKIQPVCVCTHACVCVMPICELLTKEYERKGDYSSFTLSLADMKLTYMVVLCCNCWADWLFPSVNKENRRLLGRTLALSIITPQASVGREDTVWWLCSFCASPLHFLNSLLPHGLLFTLD